MATADAEVRQILRTEVLRPSVVEPAIEAALEMLQCEKRNDQTRRPNVERDLAAVEKELRNLTETAARGGGVPAVLEALTQRDQERRRLTVELERLDATPVGEQADRWRAEMRALLGAWDALLFGKTPEARPVLDRVLAGE